MFHISWALALGFNPRDGDAVETGGTAGDVRTWFFDINLVVAGHRFPARAGFVYSPILARGGLLGRADFFNAFNVGFDQRGLRLLYEPSRSAFALDGLQPALAPELMRVASPTTTIEHAAAHAASLRQNHPRRTTHV